MDTLHTVLRSISETKGAAAAPRRDHLAVFREFLRHLDRAHKQRAAKGRSPRRKSSSKSKRSR